MTFWEMGILKNLMLIGAYGDLHGDAVVDAAGAAGVDDAVGAAGADVGAGGAVAGCWNMDDSGSVMGKAFDEEVAGAGRRAIHSEDVVEADADAPKKES